MRGELYVRFVSSLAANKLSCSDILPEGWSLLLMNAVNTTTSSLSPLDYTENGVHHPPSPAEDPLERMWVSGSFTFPKNVAGLRISEKVQCDSRIESILEKKGKDGRIGYYVNQVREMKRIGEEIPAVIEKRSHLYRSPLSSTTASYSNATTSLDATSVASVHSVVSVSSALPRPSLPAPDFTFKFLFEPAHLFRFSALTFNTHKIHWDAGYAIDVEKREGLVVHGPLTALLTLNTFRKALVESNTTARRPRSERLHIKSFDYRAVKPLIVGTEARFNVKWEEGGNCKLWVDDLAGNIYMSGTGMTH